MTKNTKTVSMTIIVVIAILSIVLIGRDLWLQQFASVNCEDGPRQKIDIRDFSTQYSAYAVELEASIADKARISTKLNPTQLQQLSEATQNAQEFRKYVVAGFNSCAITKTQYARFGTRFQTLDNLALEINAITKQSVLSPQVQTRLARLIVQYGELARKLGSD